MFKAIEYASLGQCGSESCFCNREITPDILILDRITDVRNFRGNRSDSWIVQGDWCYRHFPLGGGEKGEKKKRKALRSMQDLRSNIRGSTKSTYQLHVLKTYSTPAETCKNLAWFLNLEITEKTEKIYCTEADFFSSVSMIIWVRKRLEFQWAIRASWMIRVKIPNGWPHESFKTFQFLPESQFYLSNQAAKKKINNWMNGRD